MSHTCTYHRSPLPRSITLSLFRSIFLHFFSQQWRSSAALMLFFSLYVAYSACSCVRLQACTKHVHASSSTSSSSPGNNRHRKHNRVSHPHCYTGARGWWCGCILQPPHAHHIRKHEKKCNEKCTERTIKRVIQNRNLASLICWFVVFRFVFRYIFQLSDLFELVMLLEVWAVWCQRRRRQLPPLAHEPHLHTQQAHTSFSQRNKRVYNRRKKKHEVSQKSSIDFYKLLFTLALFLVSTHFMTFT